MAEVEIEWEEPPDPLVGRYLPFFDELRKHPGRWAVFKRQPKNYHGGVADHLKHGRYRGIEPGELEVRTKVEGEGRTIYVRIPPQEENE